MCTGKANGCRVRPRTEWLLVLAVGLLLALAAGAAVQKVSYRCEVVYLPTRNTWVRTVEFTHDGRQLRAVTIDGVPTHRFAVGGTTVHTAVDNERIVFDTGALSWRSDFRGLAQGQGRCERK